MNRYTSIYMFDRAKAATSLYEDLQYRLYYTKTFKEYIGDKKTELNEGKLSFGNILETVRNDINMITSDDLLEITLFFKSQLYPLFLNDSLEIRDEYFRSLYDYLGITLLYELPNAACTAYVYQYENYTDFFSIERQNNKDLGANIRSQDFLRFNDYVIMVTERILESKLHDHTYELTEEEEMTINKVKTENQDRPLLFEIVEKELEFLKKVFYPNDRSPYTQTVYHAYNFLKKSIEIRSRIDVQKNPRIFILDSFY